MALVSLVSHNWHLLEETARGLEAALVYSNGQSIEINLAVNLSHASLLSPVKHSAGLMQMHAGASQLFSCGAPVAQTVLSPNWL